MTRIYITKGKGGAGYTLTVKKGGTTVHAPETANKYHSLERARKAGADVIERVGV